MFDPAVFAARREAYLRALGPSSVAIVRSLPERLRNGDAYHLFRQHSDVYYLTGFQEPDATLVLRSGAEKPVTMFVRPRDPAAETWTGRRAGVEGAVATYGASVAYPAAELASRLGELIANTDEVHWALGVDEELDRMLGAALARLRMSEKKGLRPPRAVVDPRTSLHELRLHKAPEELAAMREAAAISADAHVAAMRAGKPGVTEYELEALLAYEFRSHGGDGPGYASIVGTGDNATILHYVENDARIADGDLVLVDAGCEYARYTADITRTWPANGRFSDAQRAVYEVVLEVQKAAVALAVPGASLAQIHDFVIRGLTEGMIRLGLLEGTADERIADESFKKFYMHGTSHWLGLDVHDAGAYAVPGAASRPLAPGMVITVEPGLYIAAHDEAAPPQLRGIGVRIEDDILVTAGGNENLTAACPKEIADLERICSR
ncbi:MAG TPA: aminopeptidase P N-terminal domain-containing protein [Kofleriaceae bacterium]|jgi:Xaa-Pro aminopeptidase